MREYRQTDGQTLRKQRARYATHKNAPKNEGSEYREINFFGTPFCMYSLIQSYPVIGFDRPAGLQQVEAPRISRHMNVVRVSALGNIPGADIR